MEKVDKPADRAYGVKCFKYQIITSIACDPSTPRAQLRYAQQVKRFSIYTTPSDNPSKAKGAKNSSSIGYTFGTSHGLRSSRRFGSSPWDSLWTCPT